MRWVIGILIIGFAVLMLLGSLAALAKEKDEQKRKDTKKAVWGFVVIGVIGWFVIPHGSGSSGNSAPATTASSPQNSPATQPPSPPVTQTADKPVYSIGMTPSGFKSKFNTEAQANNSPFSISSINIEQGPVQDTFKYMFTNHLGLIGTVNKKDGTIRDVSIMGQGDGSLQSGVDILTGIADLIDATNPNPANTTLAHDVSTRLGLFDKNADLTNIDKSTTINGFRYHITGDKTIGIMFDVGNANDN